MVGNWTCPGTECSPTNGTSGSYTLLKRLWDNWEREGRGPSGARGGQAGVKLSSGHGRSAVLVDPEQLWLPACRQGSWGLTTGDLWGGRVRFCYGFGTRWVEHALGDGPTLTTVCATTLGWVSYKVSYYKLKISVCERREYIVCVRGFVCEVGGVGHACGGQENAFQLWYPLCHLVWDPHCCHPG